MIAFLGAIIEGVRWKLIPSPPKLVTESEEVDLGVLDPGIREFNLTIRNGGGELLTLTEIYASCGCTSVSNCGPIPGGESGIISGKVSVVPGSGSSRLLLRSNTPGGEHSISLRWFGKREPQVVPSVLEVSAKPCEILSKQLRIVYAAGQELQIVRVSNSKVTLNWKTSSPSSDQLQGSKLVTEKGYIDTLILSLDIEAPRDPGEYSVPTTIQCRQGTMDYELPLLLKFEVLGGIYTKPRKVFLAGSSVQNQVGQSFSVKVFTDGTVDGVFVQSKPDFLQCNIKQDDRFGSSQCILEGKITTPPPKELKEFSIVLKNSSGESFVLEGKLLGSASRN